MQVTYVAQLHDYFIQFRLFILCLYQVMGSVATALAWSRLRAIANTSSELSWTELIPNKKVASQIQLELRLRLRSWLKPAWPSS